MNASAHRAKARAVLRGNWATAVLAAFVVGLLSGDGTALNIVISPNKMPPVQFTVPWQLEELLDDALGLPPQAVFGVSLVMLLAGLLLGGVMQLGSARYNLSLIDGREAKLRDVFSGIPRFSEALVMHLIRRTLETIGYVLLLVPGMVLRYGFLLAPFILTEDPACTGREALRRSWEMMRGHKREMMWLELSFLGWTLLASIYYTFGVVKLFLTPYRNAAHASFYRELSPKPDA